MNEKLLQTTSSKKDIYAHNLKYFKWLEFFSSLYFIVPIWVIIELKFLTLSELLIVEGVIAGSQLFLELPTGALADLLGRKNTITLGFLIGAIGFGLFSFATNFIQFLIIGILFGLQASLISGAKEALVFDTLKQAHREEEYSPLINKLQIIFNWGIAGATLIGGLMFALNFYLPGILNGLAFLIATFIAAKLIEPDIDSEIFTLKNYLKQTKEGFRELFKTPQSKDISLYYILIGGLTWPFVVALQNISLTLMGFNEKQMGLIIPAMMLGSIYILHFLIKKDYTRNIL